MLFRSLPLNLALMGLLCLGLSGCSSLGGGRGGGGAGEYKIGNPYQVDGVTYYPKENYHYDETGIASWYGADFVGKRTANGETFDPNELTAAHNTLPMPSLVRVTNLDNGRSVVVRVNDRGPFSNGRIIDVSRRAAELLDFAKIGTAKVRVQILAEESRAIADVARKRGMTGHPTTQVASIEQPAAPMPMITPVDDTAEQRIHEAYGSAAEGTAPQNAKLAAVEAVPLGPSPVTVQQLPAPPPSPPIKTVQAVKPPVGKLALPKQPKHTVSVLKEPKPKTVAGHEIDGRFYPAAKFKQTKAKKGEHIYVQAGAFTKEANAKVLKSKLTGIAHATINKAKINGANYYRVRVGPIATVEDADRVLAKVLKQSDKAHITVE